MQSAVQKRGHARASPRYAALSLFPLILIVVTLATMGLSLGNQFVTWDDRVLIYGNPAFNPPSIRGTLGFWTKPDKNLYVPLVYTLWAMTAAVAQLPEPAADGAMLDASYFHAVSLAIHVGTVLMVFAILRRLVRRDWAALFGALLFAVHPLQAESVAWASSQKSLACGFFSMLAIWQYLIFATSRDESNALNEGDQDVNDMKAERAVRGDAAANGPDGRAMWHWFVAAAAITLGALCSPLGAMTPAAAAALDWAILRRPARRVLASALPLLAVGVPWIVVARLVQRSPSVPAIPIWARPLIATDSLAFYLFKFLLPINLGVDYGRMPQVVLRQGWLYWTWTLPAAAAVAIVLLRKGRPWLWTAAIVSGLALAPVLGLAPFDFQLFSTVADRYMYIAMLGPALVIAGFVDEYTVAAPRRAAVFTAGGVVILALAVLCGMQMYTWHDSIELWQHAADVNPSSDAAHGNLSAALLAASPPQVDRAVRELTLAVELNPDFVQGHVDLAQLLIHLGRTDEAIAQLKTCIDLEETSPNATIADKVAARDSLGQLLLNIGKSANAATFFRQSLTLFPGDAIAREGLEKATRVRPANGPQ